MMKINFSNSVLLSILPVFFFISGCISLLKPSLSLYVIKTDNLIPQIVMLALVSYLFLRDMISVIIGFGCAVDTMFGLLFFIDLFKVEYSLLAVAAITISVGFSIFLNTVLLSSIQKNKKPSEWNAKDAVCKTLKMNLWIAILSCATLALLYIFNALQYDSAIAFDFLCVTIAGLIMSFINCFMLLPLLSNHLLGHLNEERMQDDLELSYTEKLLLQLNQNIEKAAALLVWIISPVVNNKITAFFITALTAIILAYFASFFFEYISSIENFSISLVTLIIAYFLLVVIRYESYFLALIPVFSILLNYCLLAFITQVFLSDSPIIMEISLYSSISITVVGTYFQTDTTLHYFKNNSDLENAILNATAKTLSFIFISTLTAAIFIFFSMYLINGFDRNIIIAAFILICAGIVLLFPVPAYLRVFISLHQYAIKPRKRKIKSIYL